MPGKQPLVKLTPARAEQLMLGLQVDDAADDAAERLISPAEALLISNTARDAFEDGSAGKARWVEDYRELRDAGWPWRVAAWIAWSASPRTDRWPETQQDLATEVLGLRSDRVIRKWRENNPTIDAAVGVLQAQALFEHRAAIFEALVTSATTADHKNHPDRKLALEMLGDYTPKHEITGRIGEAPDDLSQLSEEELAEEERRLPRGQKVEGGG